MSERSPCPRDEALLELSAGQVDLWFTRVDRLDARLVERYHELLTPDERAQHGRFRFEKDRLRYLVTRALTRDALSRYLPVAPQHWRFEPDRYGKPCIVEPGELAQRIEFNISHTEGLVLIGLGCGRALGVDVECIDRKVQLDIADRFFAPIESLDLRRLPADARAFRFWELWTLKESYIKARGMGLSIGLDRFGFRLDGSNGISLEFAAGFDDSPGRWCFWQMRPTEQHLLALCVQADTDSTTPIRLSLREAAPLGMHRFVNCPIDRCSAGVASSR